MWSRLNRCTGWTLRGDLNPGCLNYSLLARKPMGLEHCPKGCHQWPVRACGLAPVSLSDPINRLQEPWPPLHLSKESASLLLSHGDQPVPCSSRGCSSAAPTPSMESDLDLAHLLSPPRVLLGPCLPTEPQWTAHSPPFRSFTVLSPVTFSFPLFQPLNVMATLGPCHLLGWPHLWKVPCTHTYSVATASDFFSLYHLVLP